MITGGARSGKSALAEKMCRDTGKRVGYIATAVVTDSDMQYRIQHHRSQRPKEWVTFEQYSNFSKLDRDKRFADCDVFALDCITTMITNLMIDSHIDFETCSMDQVQMLEDRIKSETDNLIAVMRMHSKQLIIVTNEVGQGVVPSYRMGNLFRDISGRINADIAKKADQVYCMISGLSLKLK
ncbi:MAG: bifunctional adenosylcobinamide kinase/adenosylcobinamide-phosphate guanylyltransferase [Christensenellales bacterium]